MMRRDINHIKGIGFDDVTDDIVKMLAMTQDVSFAHAVRILIRIANDTLDLYPDIIDAYKDGVYNVYKDGVYNE